MSVKIRFFDNDGFKEIRESIEADNQKIISQVNSLGEKTSKKMKEIINDNKVRPQAGEPTTLEDNIDVEHFSNNAGWGVGNIDKLNEKAKHWRAVNFGSNHLVGMPLPLGHFDPDPGDGQPNDKNFRKGRWKIPGNFSAIIKRPIPAMNYIQKTIDFLRDQINSISLRK